MSRSTLKEGDRFELYSAAACIAASGQNLVWNISAGARGRVLLARPKHKHGCALVEFLPPPQGAPRKFFVRYVDMLLLDPPAAP